MKTLIVILALVLVIGCSSVSASLPVECGGVLCSYNAYCYNDTVCKCFSGYYGNGTDCYDINECENSEDYCSPNANCSNAEGSFYCECFEGYTGNGYNCTELCLGLCAAYAYCSYGSCVCDYGFTGDGYTNCTDIDECEYDYYCSQYASCNNTIGGFECECFEGYTGDGYNCEELCDQPCTEYAYCYDGTCVCDYGFTGYGYEDCYDIDECYYGEDICEYAYCNNTIGSYECFCQDGYYYSYSVEDCIPFEGTYYHRPIVLDGCDPEQNAEYRYRIREGVKQLLYERYNYYYYDSK